MWNPIDLAWAAGLFEGEGCFTFQGSKKARTRGGRLGKAQLSMTDEDVVRKFHTIMGFGSLREQKAEKRTDTNRNANLWCVTH